ncbi:hypothetical protein MNBD_ALPHA05-434 [hydrothermal vent metagenome]|uniref:Uncharacterized protein n=1 Tax=hydrothermal vent metagenome TaxID=652676 RepID=A0A3B0S7M7_9ZZZZ
MLLKIAAGDIAIPGGGETKEASR